MPDLPPGSGRLRVRNSLCRYYDPTGNSSPGSAFNSNPFRDPRVGFTLDRLSYSRGVVRRGDGGGDKTPIRYGLSGWGGRSRRLAAGDDDGGGLGKTGGPGSGREGGERMGQQGGLGMASVLYHQGPGKDGGMREGGRAQGGASKALSSKSLTQSGQGRVGSPSRNKSPRLRQPARFGPRAGIECSH